MRFRCRIVPSTQFELRELPGAMENPLQTKPVLGLGLVLNTQHPSLLCIEAGQEHRLRAGPVGSLFAGGTQVFRGRGWVASAGLRQVATTARSTERLGTTGTLTSRPSPKSAG
jgi:hypothetical protein